MTDLHSLALESFHLARCEVCIICRLQNANSIPLGVEEHLHTREWLDYLMCHTWVNCWLKVLALPKRLKHWFQRASRDDTRTDPLFAADAQQWWNP